MIETKIKYIMIDSISQLKQLVVYANGLSSPAFASRGSVTVDCSSLLGLLSIDTSQRFTIEYPKSEKEFENFISQFEC